MPARKVDAGIPVVRSTDLSGKGTVFPASKIKPGDAVIRLTDLSGKGIVVRADGGDGSGTDSSAVDPCKSLIVGMKPGSATKMLISWVPGDNNDSVEFEVSTTKFSDVHNDPMMDLQVTWGDVITCEYEMMPLLYCQWHYVTIWGRRKGRYSKVALRYRFLFPMANILPYLKMWVTMRNDIYWGYPGDLQGAPECNQIWGGPAGPSWDNPVREMVLTFPSVPDPRVAGVAARKIFPGITQQWAAESAFCITIQSSSHPLYGKVFRSEFPYDYLPDWKYVDMSEFFTPENQRKGEWYCWSWFEDYVDHPGENVYYQPKGWCFDRPFESAGPLGSFWLPGDSPYDRESRGPRHEYVTLLGRNPLYAYPWNIADTIIVFNDGGYNYNTGWLAFRLTDPDHGIFEIWAKCAGEWYDFTNKMVDKYRDQIIYFGELELCSNIGDEEHLTYHGFLPISLLDLT